ncbi:MAG: sigma-54-dependent Fis family transcriptional regulator [Tissierellaceae bacterium]|jgi:transcriptional regulator with PAS, ATPase and Fis domain
MSYLKLIDDKIQERAESFSAILNVETTVVDNNLLRVAGTGDFYYRINENSPEDSLFAKVLENGEPILNIYDSERDICLNCSHASTCKERKSLIYPIKIDNEVIGVVSFASFNLEQDEIIISKVDEYLYMLEHFAQSIEKEILSIKMRNQLNKGNAEINGIINYINKGIIILDKEHNISHINTKAIKLLDINFYDYQVINRNINEVIKNIEIKETGDKEVTGTWKIGKRNIRVIYKISYLVLDRKNISILIDFDTLTSIINTAASYNSDNLITFDNIIGCSPSLQAAKDKSRIAAKSDSTIFLHGDSGTGKEMFARAIHNESNRRDGPFVAINCATLPENLIESELFGYEKGSFTGANPKGKIGKFEQANNGTLFLDEVADIPLHLQAKLLRVLQEKKIDRIGGTTPIDVNVRIISATHKDLEQMIKSNLFREDLFYRLNVIPIVLPSLKDRPDDIVMSSQYIINKLCKRMDKPVQRLSKEVEKSFLSYKWAGNFRELENVLEYAINFSHDEEIGMDDLPEYFVQKLEEEKQKELLDELDSIDVIEIKSLEEMTNEYEKKIIKKLMDIYGDDTKAKQKIAKKLGISVVTLYRKLNNYYCE